MPSVASTPDARRANACSSAGATASPTSAAATTRSRSGAPLATRTTSSVATARLTICDASPTTRWPAGVSVSADPTRSISGSPRLWRSAESAWLTAGSLTPRALAAARNDPSRTTSTKTFSWLSVTADERTSRLNRTLIAPLTARTARSPRCATGDAARVRPNMTAGGHPCRHQHRSATSARRASSHAVTLLEQLGPEARLVAGGHSLLPMMKLRLARPEHLIDINDLVDELSYVRVEDDELRIGAMTRHAELLASAVAGEHFRIFHDAERVIADPVVRNRGTIGGSLGQADPSEDLSAVFAALRAVGRDPGLGRHADGVGARVPPWPVRDGGRRRRDDHRDPRADPPGRRQRLPQGRAARRRLGDRRGRRRGLARRRHDQRRRHRAHRRRRRALLRPGRRGRAARPDGHRRAHRAAGTLAAEHDQPVHRPARTGRLQAPPRRRADQAGAANRHRPGARRCRDERHDHRQRRDAHRRRRAARPARAPAARPLRAHRHPLGVRHVELRRLRRAPRRHAGEELHGARRDGRRPLRRHRRGTRRARRSRPGAAGLHGVPRPAVRVLHAGDDADRPWLLDRDPDPSEEDIREAISGQLCRCTGYHNIVKAVRWAAEHSTPVEVTS